MREIVPRALMSRRGFLQRLAASGAALAAAPRFPSLVTIGQRTPTSVRIGLLLPPFRSFPRVGASFVDGLALYTAQHQTRAELRLFAADAASYAGISAEDVTAFCQELGVDIVVSMANPSAVDGVCEMLQGTMVPVLVSHAGANFMGEPRANVFYNSLGYWQASNGAGAWAAETLGRKAVVVSSFYESGYDALYAFEAGLREGGGTVRARHTTHVPGRSVTMASLMHEIAVVGPDFVYAHASGPAAADFITAYSSSRHTRHMPLVVSNFFQEDGLTAAPVGALHSVHSVASWSRRLQSAENEAFCTAFQAQYGRPPDSFAALGYDTAGLIGTAAQLAASKGVSLAAALREAEAQGPRGRLTVDKATSAVTPPLYLRHATWVAGGYRDEVVGTLAAAAEGVVRMSGPRSGWIHPYLSI